MINLYLKLKYLFCLDFVIVIFLIILFTCTKIFYNPIKLDSPILVADSTLKCTFSELSQHNLNLISSLEMRETLGANSILSNNDGLRQTRSIYIGVIGILLTFIFTRRDNNKAYIIILSLIVLFYGLDIHLKDLIQRSIDSNQITSHALDSIVKQKPIDNIWYNIDYSKRNLQYPNIRDARIFRKLNAAFNPNIVQIVFFLFPFVAIYMILTIKYRKIDKKINTT